ncbi:transcriptional regulator, AraC family [Clostridium pasteurianum DSM 525 = ATCC 6013]|uniref:Transcriptional regulator with only HTH domain, AraC family n=1 Tax=Clostridium pasteurianum DSM 525 = ATCC 6013 TaxID=1262449 RepID=A0A0H3JAS7_CLOPA|nr:AraC family transcriptional regulator [Clostridium pasteurianum]AJA48825.1 transcriptional regulator, AraC family [Clostridium pasteurianum DSM 525 = ATCC 6013]AJA52813.1 transcriptional regulator, AraC family [Clostridium pasteurianum DSM 525 = ATCC 6013]AOZ76037.1 AraC family transcriptional regulator [Clostridium pasteurianum DSM 525 = ATCC 6013]AOZ79833.1 AraC family transcriptional regulator [Clostridium pasteurianum]ELP60121.1 helix-turn-helix domain-containing protein [Clostridium pa
MPQMDRHKNRTVYIEFIADESFSNLPYKERFTIIFITSGSMNLQLNDYPIKIVAPSILCLSMEDTIQVSEKQNVSSQSFCFHPNFFNTAHFSESQGYMSTSLKIETGLSLFKKDNIHNGVYTVTEKSYPKLYEWFFVIGTEVYAQSDSLWVCRIKKYLIQILGLLEELSHHSEQSPVNLVLEYIHTNYSDKISLEDLTRCAHLNRVSLNKRVQDLCGCTAMGYLFSYRLKVAENLLTHTGMSLNEIARAAGFEYDTYFIKQFTAKRGMTPTEFRNSSREFGNYQ